MDMEKMQGYLGARDFKNHAEKVFHERSKLWNWAVTKRGWPDFFCILPDNSIALVEVKPVGKVWLKRQQRIVLERLARAGVACYVFDPVEGLTKILGDKDRDRVRIHRQSSRK